jgi:hypothetical protein
MTEKELVDKISKEVVDIICASKATFFVQDKDGVIDGNEALYELKAEICTRIEMYFYDLKQKYDE